MVSTASLPPRLRALVVDDEPSVRLALQYAMELDGWDVTLASSGKAALAALEEHTPHVIIADKNMPAMSGVELLRRVRETSSEVAFVIITGFGNAASAHEAMGLDLDGYLEKPFRDIFAALQTIRGYVARRLARVRLRAAHAHFARATSPRSGVPRARVELAIADPALRERMTRLLAGHCELVSSDEPGGAEAPADLLLSDDTSEVFLAELASGALWAVLARTGVLAELLAFVDRGASAVLDPLDSDEQLLRRLDALLLR